MEHVKNIATYKYFQMSKWQKSKEKKAYFGKSNIYDMIILYNETLKTNFEKADVKDTPTKEYVFKFFHCLCWFATELSTE